MSRSTSDIATELLKAELALESSAELSPRNQARWNELHQELNNRLTGTDNTRHNLRVPCSAQVVVQIEGKEKTFSMYNAGLGGFGISGDLAGLENGTKLHIVQFRSGEHAFPQNLTCEIRWKKSFLPHKDEAGVEFTEFVPAWKQKFLDWFHPTYKHYLEELAQAQ